MDFDRGGLMATKRYVDEAGIVNAGVGANLDEAASPAYFRSCSLAPANAAQLGIALGGYGAITSYVF